MEVCGHCGKPPNNAGGILGIDDNDHNYMILLCHPDNPDAPDCYYLVTVMGEPLGARKGSH